jgi:DNA polymerase-3 subunit gamma/tau
VVAALYRRYRPETFAELIGQSQVTDPLRTALRTDRVNHAYLFSGPRGCGKTTSARILARCLNCAEGPTDTPCGICPSCVELSRDGGGSLDVVEIDAASHNGVDDARDLRERAVFAPARDRFKIFILDEAHMVTPQGFNALLKIVEEPPEHVKFIFATTEPEKVIGTIRSRTHHYPFRLVPPAQMLDYVQQLCTSEGVEVEAGVLPLVVRAGGGSVRDTLSLLDQLIAGSEGTQIDYERAVALLGYTHGALLDEVVDAIGARDAAAVFGAVDRVIQTGQDPRRFVEDLLERLRDLIIVAATSGNAAAVLRGVPQDQLDRMSQQAATFGTAELSRAADVVNAALTEMTGATSPRLHLELMVARILVPASDDTERGALARVERLERRVGVEGSAPPRTQAEPSAVKAAPVSAPVSAPAVTPASAPAVTPAAQAPAVESPAARPTTQAPTTQAPAAQAPAAPAPTAQSPTATPAAQAPTTETPSAEPPARAPATETPATKPTTQGPAAETPADDPAAEASSAATKTSAAPALAAPAPAAPAPAPAPADPAPAGPPPAVPVSAQQVKDAWPEILESVQKSKMSAWTVVYTSQVRSLVDDVLTLSFVSQNDVDSFKQPQGSGEGVSEILRRAILEVLGIRVKFIAKAEVAASEPPAPASDVPPVATDAEGWAVVTIPASEPVAQPAAPTKAPRQKPDAPKSAESKRYGESVVRELLGASFIEEQPIAPRVVPVPKDD